MKCKTCDMGLFVCELLWRVSHQFQCVVWCPCMMQIFGVRKYVIEQVCNHIFPVSSNTLLNEVMEPSVHITKMASTMI